MAFPQVAATTTGLTATVNQTNQDAVLPTPISAGDLLVLAMALDDTNGNDTATPPSGWTEILDATSATGPHLYVCAKIADGTEDGATVTVVNSGSERGVYRVWRITGAHASAMPEAATSAHGTSTAPDPGSLTPSWGSEDTLWMALAALDDGTIAITGYPTSYTNGASDADGASGGATLGSARRELAATSDNPSAFTAGSSTVWTASTLGIRTGSGDTTKDTVDTGAGTEALAVDAAIDVTDTGVGTDVVDAVVDPGLVADSGTGSDVVSAEQSGAEVTDSGVGTDVVSVEVTAAVEDSGAGTDFVELAYAEWVVADVGVGTEAVTVDAALAVTDTGVGLDVVDSFEGAIFTVYVNSINRSGVIDIDSFRIVERTGRVTAHFTLTDAGGTLPNPQNLHFEVAQYGAKVFGGFIRDVNPVYRGRTVHYECIAPSYDALLDEVAIPDPAYRSASETDKVRAQWLMGFDTHGFTAGAFVQTVFGTLPGGLDNNPEQDFGGKTLREALDQLARVAGADFYVDMGAVLNTVDGRLHWYPAGSEGLAAPFNIDVDAPNGTTTHTMYDLKFEGDTGDTRNAVFIRGLGVRGWYPDPPPSAATRRAGTIREDEITTAAQLEAAGAAYLQKHGGNVAGTGVVVVPGLHAGMVIAVTSAEHGLVAAAYQVESVEYTMHNRALPIYTVTIGRRPRSLADIIAENRPKPGTGPPGEGDDDVAARNRFINSSYEDDGDDHTVPAGVTFVTNADSYHGAKVARVLRSAATLGDFTQSAVTKVKRSRQYHVGLHLRRVSHASGTLRLELREYNSGGTLQATTTIRDIVAADDIDDVDFDRIDFWIGDDARPGRKAFHANTKSIRLVVKSVASLTAEYHVDAIYCASGRLIADYTLRPSELAKLQVENKHVKDDAIDRPKIGPGAVGGTELDNNVVAEPHLIDDEVTQIKLRDLATFKILGTGTINCPGNTGPGSSTATQNVNVGGGGGRRAVIVYVDFGAVSHPTPWTRWAAGGGSGITPGAMLHQYYGTSSGSGSTVTVLVAQESRTGQVNGARIFRYFVLKEQGA